MSDNEYFEWYLYMLQVRAGILAAVPGPAQQGTQVWGPQACAVLSRHGRACAGSFSQPSVCSCCGGWSWHLEKQGFSSVSRKKKILVDESDQAVITNTMAWVAQTTDIQCP